MMIARQARFRTALVLSAALFLSACGEDEGVVEAQADDERLASGEVLDGTITDAMIPLDQLQSQAPPMRVEPNGNSAPAGDESAAPQPVAATQEAPLIEAEAVIDLAPPADPAPIAPAPE